LSSKKNDILKKNNDILKRGGWRVMQAAYLARIAQEIPHPYINVNGQPGARRILGPEGQEQAHESIFKLT